jgi:hypothetical protein
MIQKIINIGVCVLAGTAIVAILYRISGTPNTQKNGFTRNIKSRYLTISRAINLQEKSSGITGATNNRIYINNPVNPVNISEVDYYLSKNKPTGWYFSIHPKLNSTTVGVDSPYINIYQRGKGIITTYHVGQTNPDWMSDDSIPGRQFDLAHRISSNSFVVRTTNSQLRQYTLTKVVQGQGFFKENTNAISGQADGYLSADGLLLFDKETSKIVYIYLYRNQYMILDSNLEILQTGRTIDTIRHAQLSLYNYKNVKYTTFDGPALITNKNACTCKGRLYVQSALLSDNEDRKMFSNNTVIDMYDLEKRHYQTSFYVPRFNGHKVDEFRVYDTLLMAIQGNFIVSYIINKS